jgi:hypothetical protein
MKGERASDGLRQPSQKKASVVGRITSGVHEVRRHLRRAYPAKTGFPNGAHRLDAENSVDGERRLVEPPLFFCASHSIPIRVLFSSKILVITGRHSCHTILCPGSHPIRRE